MKWLILLIAGMCEVLWAVAMNYSDGFSKLLPSVITVVGYIASAVFLSMALKQLPLGTTYAIWTGIGIIGTTICGVLLFHEQLSLPKFICILMILFGIIGLNLLSGNGK